MEKEHMQNPDIVRTNLIADITDIAKERPAHIMSVRHKLNGIHLQTTTGKQFVIADIFPERVYVKDSETNGCSSLPFDSIPLDTLRQIKQAIW